jgi:hypothetical protein
MPYLEKFYELPFEEQVLSALLEIRGCAYDVGHGRKSTDAGRMAAQWAALHHLKIPRNAVEFRGSVDEKNLKQRIASMLSDYAKICGQKESVKRRVKPSRFEPLVARLSESKAKNLIEMAVISKVGKTVMADNEPLKSATADVDGNIVIMRVPETNMLFHKGFTLVYFMSSDDAAKRMAAGKIPYKMIHDRPMFAWGSSPITDIWKKKFDKDQSEILGMLQGTTDEKEIYIDKMSVRPAYRRSSINTRMVNALKKNYPNAAVNFSGPTKDGSKFIKSHTGKEWEPAHGEHREF